MAASSPRCRPPSTRCPLNTVRICAGTFGAIVIAKDLTLVGVGDGADNASNTILDGEGNGTVVQVNAGVTVSLQGLASLVAPRRMAPAFRISARSRWPAAP
ncbi:MAG: hypothetical protein U0075_14785 [Thermomicrobiales bacterium]